VSTSFSKWTRVHYPTDSIRGVLTGRIRHADHGEVFTPGWLVEAMLDPVKSETERIDAVTGAERNQGAVVNCRFDPTLHGRGLILRGVRVSSGLTRIK
jgi:hypothetical protein